MHLLIPFVAANRSPPDGFNITLIFYNSNKLFGVLKITVLSPKL